MGEFFGSACLTATVVGSGIMGDQLSGGNDALALLANSIATGLMLYVLISLLGPISGAHFNPFVSLYFGMQGAFPKKLVLPYSLVQVLGSVCGVWVTHIMFGQEIIQLSSKVRFGPNLWVSETIATIGLLMTISLALKNAPNQIATLVGSYICAAYWFTSSTSFANPMMSIARSLTNSFAGIQAQDAPPFIAAQFLGVAITLVGAKLMVKN
jgi:glycerol uptake facilitator-like aquaporin